jgi:hypothetical protein
MAKFKSDIVLGKHYRDGLSGFAGVATAVSFNLHGPEQVRLEMASFGTVVREVHSEWFDAPRLIESQG